MSSNSEGSGYYLFGRDIMAIPCLRASALSGFAASTTVSLLWFLFTSNGIQAFKYGQAAFIGVTFPYWYICRSYRYKQEELIYQAQRSIGDITDDEYIITDSLEYGPETFG